jgi:hypothetical protein
VSGHRVNGNGCRCQPPWKEATRLHEPPGRAAVRWRRRAADQPKDAMVVVLSNIIVPPEDMVVGRGGAATMLVKSERKGTTFARGTRR